jgi:hypothetical protein
MSFIIISLGISPLLLASIGLPLVRRLSLLILGGIFLSTLRVTILIAIGEGFFLGVASTDIELELLVNRLSYLRGLPSTLPYLPSLFLFSTYSLSLIN